jgi:magnesium-transporting ATPase (P-type)
MFRIRSLLLGLGLITSLSFITPSLVSAQVSELQCGANSAATGSCSKKPKDAPDLNDTVAKIINILSSLVAVVAVIMIIVGGFRYVTSGGDSSKVERAKNTILNAIIGVVIAVFAQVIVRFVIYEAKK